MQIQWIIDLVNKLIYLLIILVFWLLGNKLVALLIFAIILRAEV